MPQKADYPGLGFTPPDGTLDPAETEGEALVKWKKVGDLFTIVEFEGKPMTDAQKEDESVTMDKLGEELTEMEEGEI